MNILVIGNGFDLAHGLPTTYLDFLKFTKIINMISRYYKHDNEIKLEEIKSHFESMYQFESIATIINCFQRDAECINLITRECPELIRNFYDLIKDNLWINYFNEVQEKIGNSWIDFEAELCSVIRQLENGKYKEINSNAIMTYIEKCEKDNLINEVRKKLELDLEYLIGALEIYLRDYVGKIVVTVRDKNILNLKINKVLSFNYTNTYENNYNEDNAKKSYHYVHGEAKKHGDKKSNMILGFNEYLESEEKKSNTSFIKFRKYYQRIYKETDGEYHNWLDTIKEQNLIYSKKQNGYFKIKLAIWFFEKPASTPWGKKIKNKIIRKPRKYYHNVYFFGHSLDTVDKDIITALILNNNVRTTIFYHNEETHARLIANLVKNIGVEEVVKRTGGKKPTILFVQQQNDATEPIE